MSKKVTEFKVGDMAEHKYFDLDARKVVQVSEDGLWIRLLILDEPSSWLLANNYRRIHPSTLAGSQG